MQSVPSESTLSEFLFGSLFLWNFFYFLLQKGPKNHRQRRPLEWPPWAPLTLTTTITTYLSHQSYRLIQTWIECPFLVNVHHFAKRVVDAGFCWTTNSTNVANAASNETVLNLFMPIASNTSPNSRLLNTLSFFAFFTWNITKGRLRRPRNERPKHAQAIHRHGKEESELSASSWPQFNKPRVTTRTLAPNYQKRIK